MSVPPRHRLAGIEVYKSLGETEAPAETSTPTLCCQLVIMTNNNIDSANALLRQDCELRSCAGYFATAEPGPWT